MALIRIDKYIANQSSLTRSEVSLALKKGRITVNGQIVKDKNLKFDPDTAAVTLDGRPISYEEHVYFLLNKPAGVVSATEDNLHKTVVDLIDCDRDIFPVGRLDIDTEGLLILTDDGDFAHRLLSPKHHVDKTYLVEVDQAISPEVVTAFESGFDYGEDKPSLPARLVISDNPRRAEVTIHEGKFHQIKRMFAVHNLTVTYLKRLTMGEYTLPENLELGEYIKLPAPTMHI